MRQMVMVGFLQAQNCTTLASAWRHPQARSDFTTPAYYQRIGQILEEGKFQLASFDDRLAMPDIYGGSPVEVRHQRGSRRQDGPGGGDAGHGVRHVSARDRLDRVNHVLRAV